MPEIIYSHNHKAWIKECPKCDITFEVQATSITEAERFMLQYFSTCSSSGGANGLRVNCRSCRNAVSNKRIITVHRDEQLKEQDGKCGICEQEIAFKSRSAYVDHDHTNGKIRGVLCPKCNTRMSAVDDNEWLIKAIAYRDSFR